MKLTPEQRRFLTAVRDRTDGVAVMEGRNGDAFVTNFFQSGPPKAQINPADLLLLKERGLYENYDITEAGRAALEDS